MLSNNYTRLAALSLLMLMMIAACRDPEVFEPVATPYIPEIPAGLPPLADNPANPMTIEGVVLGRQLFYDPILSADNTLSCAGCHQPAASFVDEDEAVSVGIDGIAGNRNAMPIFNLAYSPAFGITPEGSPFGGFFWDSRSASLEDQALLPIEDPIEMHNTLLQAVSDLQAHPTYPRQFYLAFGDSMVTAENLGKAIAQFERSIISAQAPFDSMQRKIDNRFWDDDVLDGFLFFEDLFGGDCIHCHGQGAGLFTDFTYRNNGLDSIFRYTDFADPGLGAITGDTADYGKFKVPTLRNLALTAPYMHDGRFETLREVIDFYSEGVHDTPFTDPLMEFAFQGGVQMDEAEKVALEAFLLSLTDYSIVDDERFSDPFATP
jgi:cytochrome c peroxidase